MDAQYADLRRAYKTPFLVDSDPPTHDVLEAILRASDFVFEDLAVNTRPFSQFNYDDVVIEPIELNGKTLRQYKRKGDFSDVPLLVIAKDLYAPNGDKIASTYSPDDKIVMVSCNEEALKQTLAEDSGSIPQPLLAGLETIQGIIYFYQDVHLNRDLENINFRETASLFNVIAPAYAKTFHSFTKPLKRVYD